MSWDRNTDRTST